MMQAKKLARAGALMFKPDKDAESQVNSAILVRLQVNYLYSYNFTNK